MVSLERKGRSCFGISVNAPISTSRKSLEFHDLHDLLKRTELGADSGKTVRCW